ncbi:MAG: NAD-dependent epimerase/dehydratase family protein, partial [Myxococcota bacterium]|nr:NAD-dependent epimerase/dehydratase family protein [Myxococcota bacterium]
MTAVVTGAGGFVGGNLVRALLDDGQDVRAGVFQGPGGLEGLDVNLVQLDVLDEDSLVAAFTGADVVYHCAAAISIMGGQGGRVESINIQGTKNVVEACLKAEVGRLVHFSSVHALNPLPADEEIDEDRALATDDHFPAYTRSKAGGEMAVLAGVERGLDAVILNPSGIIGPYDFKPSLLGQTLMQLYNRSLPALVDGAYDFVDVRDVVQSAIVASTRGASGQRYLLSGHYSSVQELALTAESASGKRAPRMVTPLWVARWTAPLFEGFSALTGTRPLYTRES